MDIPLSCTVLVIGGGPGGSYTASVLAREGVDTVLLEADEFPRYHIGESMLASIRYFFRFIDLESKMDEYGFVRKNGSAFKLNNKKETYTDFLQVNGPNGYAWNFIRSESDMLMFQHAAESGAKTFDGVKVESIEFDIAGTVDTDTSSPSSKGPGRPISAKWRCYNNSSCSGSIKFDYLVDASGRLGILSTRYLKNRVFNQSLKNIAMWGYWTNAKPYGLGTKAENQPISEALDDASGWAWAIPLHDGTLSVGIVIRQDIYNSQQRLHKANVNGNCKPPQTDFYKTYLQQSPLIWALLNHPNGSKAKLIPREGKEIRTTSDWSYHATSYSGPGYRIVGDAGSFIDPYFSSGVHLAIAGGLSAALTIQAARKRDCDEATAAKWHSSRTAENYTRFLLIVITVLTQIRRGTEPLLCEFDEDGFDRAFGLFVPIIQGLADADVGGKLTQAKVSQTVDFCLDAFAELPSQVKARDSVLLGKLRDQTKTDRTSWTTETIDASLTDQELQILRTIRARQILRLEDALHMDHFEDDVIDGFAPRLQRGSLGLVRVVDRAAPPCYSESLVDTLSVSFHGCG